MPHGKVKLTVIWLLASSGMSRGVDGHWWCVAVLCDCCGVQRAALCCVVWFQVDREAEGFPLTAGRDECGRGGYTLPRTIINNTYSSAWSSFLYTRTVCVHDCMHVEERKTICQGMSAVGCPCVCVCVCSIWPFGFRELNSEGCPAPTHTLHETLIGITGLHTLIQLKSPLTLLFIAVVFG